MPVRVVAETGDVVAQRVQPDIGDVSRREIDRNPPAEGRSGNAEILKPRQQEVVHHLVLPRLRLDEVRMGVDVVDQPVCVAAHPEEISRLGGGLDITAVQRAFAVHQLGFGVEGLALLAVHTLVFAQIDIALVVHFPENLLDLLFVILVRRPDEVIIGRIHQVPDPPDLARGPVHIFLRRHTGRLGPVLNLLAVLVRTCLEMHVEAFQPLVARDRVRENDLVRVADMRLSGCVGDRRRDVIRFSVSHVFRLPP